MTEETIATHAIIHGRVQGVGYRAWTAAKARSLNLTGWVRNRSNGTVETMLCGTATNVNNMIAACHSGPTFAHVDKIKTNAVENEGWDRFEQKSTL